MSHEQNDARAQQLYARWLDAGTRTAFAASLVAFAVYLGGLLPAHVPLEALPRYWGLPVDEFLRRTATPPGLGWVSLIDRGEFLALASIALLPLVSLVCYLRLAFACAGLGERMQTALAAAQVVVLVAAASGWWS